MKLLLDENLRFRLVAKLEHVFPGTRHVDDSGLRAQDDLAIWSHARREGLALVSKDGDFRQLALLRGEPPKVVVQAIGNSGSDAVLNLLTAHQTRLEAFDADPQESVLVLRLPR